MVKVFGKEDREQLIAMKVIIKTIKNVAMANLLGLPEMSTEVIILMI